MIRWLLRRTRILRLQPGDVIVYRAYGKPPPEVVERVTGQMKELFPGHEVIVVTGGEIDVARRGAGWPKPVAPPPEGSRPTGLPPVKPPRDPTVPSA